MDILFDEYFKRQIELWGIESQKRLLSKKVLIVGCGGLGTSIGLAIGGSGVGYIDLVDFDEVAIHNIHRQIAFELKDNLNSKASILAKKIESRNPFIKLKVYRMDFEKFSTDKKCKYDIVIDATDNLSVRAEIDLWTKKGNTPWIYGSVEEFNAQVCLFDKASFSTFKSRKTLPKGITAPMVMQTASLQANLALRYLANLPVKKDILHYMYYNNEGDFILQKFKMPIDKN